MKNKEKNLDIELVYKDADNKGNLESRVCYSRNLWEVYDLALLRMDPHNRSQIMEVIEEIYKIGAEDAARNIKKCLELERELKDGI